MKFYRILLFSIIFCTFVCAAPKSLIAQNSINGMVFDHNRRPIPNIDVELLDDLERQIASRKTRGSGFYSFQRLNRGIYFIRIRVGGTNFKKKKVRIDLGALNAIGGVDVKQVDVHLELDSKKAGRTPSTTAVIFAQDVPPNAKRAYDQAINNIEKKDYRSALDNLQKATEIFPKYHDALLQLGNLELILGKYGRAEEILNRLVVVNPKSFVGFFGLGVAQNKMKKRSAAIKNLGKALRLDSNSLRANLLLGIVQRDAKQYRKAQMSLLRAKKLSNNESSDTNWHLALLYYHNLKNHPAAASELDSYLKNLPKADRKKNAEKVKIVKKLIKQIRSNA